MTVYIDDKHLRFARIIPTQIAAICPSCGCVHTEIAISESTLGTEFMVDEPHRYPVCDDCNTQFEIPTFGITALHQGKTSKQ